ncbi:MAG: phospho-N-acetylmuramoyl-pentapeptide-transferase [Lachnospiraceae bacterium]|jgi:phospho-N-acetylmuramoyl-pentapeptide-transferase
MVSVTTILPAVIALIITAVAAPFIIPVLRRLKMGQTERELGVKSHLKKAGTPTMGGIIFLAAILVTGIIFIFFNPTYWPVLFITIAFGALGFLDDYLKVVKKRSDGLFPKQKFAIEFIITIIFFVILKFVTHTSLAVRIPFSGGIVADIGLWAVPLMFLAILGTVNGVNFTDGLDGLASSVTIVVAAFLTVSSVLLGAGIEPVTSAVAGALMGFVVYNAFPAKVFMGDTGSLALGGFVIGAAYMMQMPLYIVIVGLVYLVEVLSVILQVGYFKISHGKRIFKMAPIHHHFELCGWSETQVVTLFTVVTAVLCMIGFLAL